MTYISDLDHNPDFPFAAVGQSGVVYALFIAVFVIAPLYFIFMGAASLLPGGHPGGPDRAEDGGDQ